MLFKHYMAFFGDNEEIAEQKAYCTILKCILPTDQLTDHSIDGGVRVA
ncbi:hypothetical protein TcasGA2_TC031829 [Tribolium castaneum]|uniref:Uncharacterized protein n=1 Tax=Tribolium castaneum TaxID=7070 RepID=A0A139W9J3_TRICA|nr:hypothetical protein TcasGA2_TC031829 [Tribolium castaneum]